MQRLQRQTVERRRRNMKHGSFCNPRFIFFLKGRMCTMRFSSFSLCSAMLAAATLHALPASERRASLIATSHSFLCVSPCSKVLCLRTALPFRVLARHFQLSTFAAS